MSIVFLKIKKEKLFKFSKEKNPATRNLIVDEIFYEVNEIDISQFIVNKIKLDFETDHKIWDIIFIYLPLADLANHHLFVALSRSKYRKFSNSEIYSPAPIVFITALNIFQNYHKFNDDLEKDYEEREKDYTNRTKYFTIDKRKYFFDSSIWHYYLPIEEWNKKKFDENLKHILNAIANNSQMGLYSTVVAKEFLEFQTRLMKHSYLEDIGDSHAKHIAPFVFHSETEMRIKADQTIENLKNMFDELEKKINEKDKKIEWDVLLIDDYAEKKLNTSENNGATKKEIIQNVLRGDFEDNKFNFKYTCTSDVNILAKVEDKIKKKGKTFDIIFLDYLLGKRNKNDNDRELGSEFFVNPKFKYLKKHKRPLGKFWFFPITSFSKAMLDKIRSSGTNHIHASYYLFDGADVITTPQLFRYKLFKLLELQIKQAYVEKEDIIDFVLENLQGVYNNKKRDSGENIEELRIRAKRLYGLFMHKFGVREALKSDADNGSAFAKSILKYINENKEAFEAQRFYEYTRKLIFLIGYGTHYDLPRMWNLFNYIAEQVPKEDKQKEVENFLDSVKDYLNELSK